MSAALEYHRATNVTAGGTDEREALDYSTRPEPFQDYGDAERLPLEISVAGPLLQDGAGLLRSRVAPWGQRIHFRGYSSAGALYPVEAYVAAPDGLYSFDALSRALVRIGGVHAHARVADAAGLASDADAFVVLTGILGRTGWKYLERGYRHVWWDAGTMLANLLALAAATGLCPRLWTAFVDRELNDVLGVDGVSEVALAVLALGSTSSARPQGQSSQAPRRGSTARRFPLAEAAHAASSLVDSDAVRCWRVPSEGEEPELAYDALRRAIARRRSVRAYALEPLPRNGLAELLAWSEAPIPADAPRVIRQLVTVAAVEGLEPGTYDASLRLVREHDVQTLRKRVGFAAMEQDFPRLAAANVFQLADLGEVVERIGERGYRWAQLEAGIRAGRLQIGAFMSGWGSSASTFYDDEVSRLLETHEAPMLMVAIGPV